MITVDEILEAVRAGGTRLEWHSYIALPSDHRFATYNIPEKNFDGADDMAFYAHFDLKVTFFYRESKQPADFKLENDFEEAVTVAGEYSCVSDYDPDNKLFYTQYTFPITEEIEKEE